MNYKVWMEGFVTNGERANHSLYGEIEADSFQEACEKLVKKNHDENIYDKTKNAIWGCHLFDNEKDSMFFDNYNGGDNDKYYAGKI